MVRSGIAITAITVFISSGSFSVAKTIDLRIIETTDMHSYMMDFDYYRDQPVSQYGLVRAATLIKKAREEVSNSVLVDNGDLIQGNPMADYIAQKGLHNDGIHPVYKLMNTLDYVVGNLGNHEFNFGLDYLKQAINGAAFPYINANVYDAKTQKPYFTQYLIIDTPVRDRDGNMQKVSIGYIGFVPPQILLWDKMNLDGKVIVHDITETARQLVPEMRKNGADLVIAIPHSGLSTDPYKIMAENSVYYLSQVAGIDAILFGHAHGVFPSNAFADLTGIDIVNGTVQGIPAVMPGQWASHIGIIDLVLEGTEGSWQVVSGRAEARPVYDPVNNVSHARQDAALVSILAEDHAATRAFVNQPIGKSTAPLYSYLALVQDDPTLQIINDAQIAYMKRYIQGDPDLADLPVLAAVAPFKAGGRKNDPAAYVEVDQGTLSVRSAADLYVYANTLIALKVKGEDIREWLECSSGIFNQINVTETKPQYLINWEGFRTYNFDIIDGVEYEIDVTQPPRYDGECVLINPDAHRIKNLTWQKKPLDSAQSFVIASNSYRAYTGKFSGTGVQNIAFASPDEVRTVLMNHIMAETQATGSIMPYADNNWRIAPILSEKKLDIRFETAPTRKAQTYMAAKFTYPLDFVTHDTQGFAVYRIDLQQAP